MRLILVTESGSRIEISSFPFLLGRSKDCHYVLEGKMASRKHAQFILENNELLLEDLNSSNGTFVNLRPLEGKIKVYMKDQLRFADIRMKVLAGPERP